MSFRESIKDMFGVADDDRERIGRAFVDGLVHGAKLKDDPARLLLLTRDVAAILADEAAEAEADGVRRIALLAAVVTGALADHIKAAASPERLN